MTEQEREALQEKLKAKLGIAQIDKQKFTPMLEVTFNGASFRLIGDKEFTMETAEKLCDVLAVYFNMKGFNIRHPNGRVS